MRLDVPAAGLLDGLVLRRLRASLLLGERPMTRDADHDDDAVLLALAVLALAIVCWIVIGALAPWA